ncbi:immunoglobulin superfamily DCC subclass member 3-like [Acanthopagrus latus]|uniref:immunoglobulin superfamily DCC subclass member 3-like n=1 Tax=Acanthopagrus latus TaxID=8177 RepID=UPI00187D0589|nr:immunoglobulin superfamily DCC subclass member 3-like [Acanthopagrus latus]XP_036931484.1 immunoglobulin superfamily DCC subclass member 3-like [Acanthopagrus latus]XP_036931485.1 immunoglobulin superfamily DCC subclass member 3-like [Acanthopagrus latus]XP_036931486.1 immunoglobulin superfamily DCC subclass member 3-like [Acanthopagrus latus]
MMKMLKVMKMLLLFGLCCSGVVKASELAFLKEPSDVIAVRDRPLMLDCQVEGEGPISITWRRNGVPVETGVRAVVLGNGTLLIRNFSKRREGNETGAGEYDCAAQNHYGMLISRKARVQLASLPKFLSHPESVAVGEGGVARLTCQVNGIPEANITWQKDQRPLSTADPRYTLLPNGVLQITAVRQTDSGLFRCVASNIANTRYSHEAQLSVTVSGSRTYREPVILSGPQNLTINVHQTAILECIATGNPRPIVSWSRLDGRSIGVEGIQVLGTGNLMISDATLQHSGVYVCSANRPGSRSRRTALGRLVVQAPPEFVQWPQSVSRPAGGSAVFSCTASGAPEPHLIWLKNGKLLTPSGNVKLTNGNTTLAITRITPEDEAIYQCIAENSAGTNQASARLAISQGPELPEAPAGLQATPLGPSSLQLTWEQPTDANQQIIGYVLHIRRLGEPDSAELQEAVSKTTFRHEVDNLDAATTYSIYLKAYSALGGSQQSNTITATTKGGVPSSPSFFTTVLNQTAMQVYWELPSKAGQLEGFRLEYRRVSNPDIQGQETFPAHINTHTISHLEPAEVYEIQLVAFNGNGDGPSNRRLVSLIEGTKTAAGGPSCNCDQSNGSVSTLLVGVHSGLACILCCLLFILLGYRRSLFCRKEVSWVTPPTLNGVGGPKGHTPESIELNQRSDPTPPPVMVMVEPTQPSTSTG